ncbi:AraC family transcriptional regulator [Paenibacillus agricola]|uniref:AraC family transcriptional regulator n=1 Tax=Paenibacillus agricola TaxID=2716264 RepID=A0ABX0JBJ2_9BACL|nr:AraC family transcriptional regulator [Paenibacillus agricola]NHN31301.1 AraC family transcriptional regulator [Paenibacillus agricola]
MLYPKEKYLESEAFPFAAFPYPTLPERPLTPHTHDFIELVYVADGRGEHLYKGHSFPVSKGDIFVIPPGVEHDYRVIGSAPLKVYNILFVPSFLDAELQALSKVSSFVNFFYVEPFLRQKTDFESHLKLSFLEAKEVQLRLERIIEEFDRKALGYRISIKALLIELLVWLSRCYDERLVQLQFRPDDASIRELCEFLAFHYAEPFHLEDVCQMCGMSKTSFTSKFKQTIGKTFTEYRNEVRIHASLKWLRETDEQIIRVAELVGVGDLSYYNKLFKQFIGMPPREFRKKYRSSP